MTPDEEYLCSHCGGEITGGPGPHEEPNTGCCQRCADSFYALARKYREEVKETKK